MTQHTPGPWEINWYHCRMDAKDVEHAKAAIRKAEMNDE